MRRVLRKDVSGVSLLMTAIHRIIRYAAWIKGQEFNVSALIKRACLRLLIN